MSLSFHQHHLSFEIDRFVDRILKKVKNDNFQTSLYEILPQEKQVSSPQAIHLLQEEKNNLLLSIVQRGMSYVYDPVERDWKNDVKFFKIASDFGDVEGMWRYGRCAFMGWSINEKEKFGKNLLNRASKLNSDDGLLFYYMTLPEGTEEELEILLCFFSNNHPAEL